MGQKEPNLSRELKMTEEITGTISCLFFLRRHTKERQRQYWDEMPCKTQKKIFQRQSGYPKYLAIGPPMKQMFFYFSHGREGNKSEEKKQDKYNYMI